MMSSTALGTVLFYVLAAGAVALAVATVVTRHIFRSAIFLMGTLSISAAFYVMLGAEFLAGVQILVYVGGIVVLIVFAVLLTASHQLQEDRASLPRRLLGLLAAAAFLVPTAYMLLTTKFHQAAHPGRLLDGTNTAAIGRQLLDRGADGYVLPFEIVSLLLLGVVLGAIVIARKTPPPAG